MMKNCAFERVFRKSGGAYVCRLGGREREKGEDSGVGLRERRQFRSGTYKASLRRLHQQHRRHFRRREQFRRRLLFGGRGGRIFGERQKGGREVPLGHGQSGICRDRHDGAHRHRRGRRFRLAGVRTLFLSSRGDLFLGAVRDSRGDGGGQGGDGGVLLSGAKALFLGRSESDGDGQPARYVYHAVHARGAFSRALYLFPRRRAYRTDRQSRHDSRGDKAAFPRRFQACGRRGRRASKAAGKDSSSRGRERRAYKAL